MHLYVSFRLVVSNGGLPSSMVYLEENEQQTFMVDCAKCIPAQRLKARRKLINLFKTVKNFQKPSNPHLPAVLTLHSPEPRCLIHSRGPAC